MSANNSTPEEMKLDLMNSISESIQAVGREKEALKVNSLSRGNPGKVAEILYHYAMGETQTKMVKKYKFNRDTVISVLTDYADHLGKFREVTGRLAARNYLNLTSLEEDLIDKVRGRLEEDPEFEVTFRDLKELSIAKANAGREALTARGEATQITEDRKVYSQEDYEATIQAARDRIKKIKEQSVDAELLEE